MTDMARLAEQQRAELSSAIGQGLQTSSILTARGILAVAPPHKDFLKHKDENFIYMKLDETTDATVQSLVDEWIANPANVSRAATAVGRRPPEGNIVMAFCSFRFKELRKGITPVDGLAAVEREHSTVVIIAVEPLGLSNGCFVNLDPGQDVCVDGNRTVILPGTDSGLGILIDLNL